MDNFDLKKYLAEGRLLKEAFYPEFEGETNDKINDIAIAVVDELESKLDSESSGILKGMDYYVGSDGMDNDEVEQGFTKWFIDLVKYLSKNNNEVTISSVEQDGKVFTPAITLKYLDNGKEDISWKIKRDLAEGRLLKEEEQEYTLYTTNVEYDNGKTGYMYQLVNSEDGEENEIGFDQLYFVGKGDASDPQVFPGKDFKDFDQGSYQEEVVSAKEAMKIYNELK